MDFVAAGEMLHVAEAFIDKNYHPTVICRGIASCTFLDVERKHLCSLWWGFLGIFFLPLDTISCQWWVETSCEVSVVELDLQFAAYNKVLEDAVAVLEKMATPIDVNDRKPTIILFLIHFKCCPSTVWVSFKIIFLRFCVGLNLVVGCIVTNTVFVKSCHVFLLFYTVQVLLYWAWWRVVLGQSLLASLVI